MSLTWAGPDRGLVAALTDHPIIHNLTWTAPVSLDLRGTGLTGLSINGTIDLLQVPDSLTSLSLMDGARVGAVTAAGNGQWLTLTITSPAPCTSIPAGLDRLRDLRQIGTGMISAAPLSVLRHLESCGWPGMVRPAISATPLYSASCPGWPASP